MAMPTTTRIAAMVAAAAIFFSTFHCVSAQGEAPAPAPLLEGGGAPAPLLEGGGAPAPTEVVAAPAPSPLAGCMDSLLNVSDCLSYVMDGSNTTKPDAGCCPELAGLVESTPICLCVLLGTNTTESYGIAIDVKKALKLPSVCGVQTPPASTCSVLGVPVPGPVGSPTASEAPMAPTSPGAQTPGGAAAAPLPGNKGNEASSIAGSALPIIVGLAIAFLPTFF